MPTATVNGINLNYKLEGPDDAETIVLINGLADDLESWGLQVPAFLEAGYRVLSFDNRGIGTSDKPAGPYTSRMLADDAKGLVDVLGITDFHLMGVSMGGMIAQTLAIDHPERLLSLVSIMASTGRRSVGWQDPRLLPMLLGKGGRSREQVVAQSAHTWLTIGSPAYPTPADEVRARAGETYDRGLDLAGVIRQMQAFLTQPDRTRALRNVRVPTLVIHGLSDRLVHVSGGRATAAAIPDAELLLVPGMGHDMPRQLWTTFADGIERTAARARMQQVSPGSRDLPHEGLGQSSAVSRSSSSSATRR